MALSTPEATRPSGHLDQLRPLADDERHRVAAEQGAAGGGLADDVTLRDGVGELRLAALDLEARCHSSSCSARSAVLPVKSLTRIGFGPLLM